MTRDIGHMQNIYNNLRILSTIVHFTKLLPEVTFTRTMITIYMIFNLFWMVTLNNNQLHAYESWFGNEV